MAEKLVPTKQPIDGVLALVALVLAAATGVLASIFPDHQEALGTAAGMLSAFSAAAFARYKGKLPGAEPKGLDFKK